MSFFFSRFDCAPLDMLIGGIYAALCHACGVLLFFNANPCSLSPTALLFKTSQMLEYSVMTLTIVTVGAFFLYLIKRTETNL